MNNGTKKSAHIEKCLTMAGRFCPLFKKMIKKKTPAAMIYYLHAKKTFVFIVIET